MRRVTIYDKNLYSSNYLTIYTLGLGDEVYSLEWLLSLPEDQRNAALTVGEGDGVMLLGGECWKLLREKYHFGVRSEVYTDCTPDKLRRLSIEGGAYIKCIEPGEFPSDEDIKDFMSPDFSKHMDFSWFRQKVITTLEGAHRFFDYLESLPLEEDVALDYETSGMPREINLVVMGFAISTMKYAGYVSLHDLRHQASEHDYQMFLKRVGAYLLKKGKHVIVFNQLFEFLVSYRLLGVDLMELSDAGNVNKLSGYHVNKNYSLKWTAQRVLQVQVWDTEFDRISDLMDSMLYTEVGKLKKDKHKELKVSLDNYDKTPEWAELMRRYPTYEKEFRAMIQEYWNVSAFCMVPTDILGFYCCLDSFYTLASFLKETALYKPETVDVFMNNSRLACRLHSCGIPIDNEFRQKYIDYSERVIAYSITYLAMARCWIKIKKHEKKAKKIDSYNPVCQILLKQSKFYNGDALQIAKDLLSNNVDTLDATETGLDEGRLMLTFGEDFAAKFIELVSDSMKSIKMKTKIDETVIRKKKLLGLVAEGLTGLLGLDKIKISPSHIELEKTLYYSRIFDELKKIQSRQIKDIDSIPTQIFAFGQKMSRIEYSDYVSLVMFKCKSPIENDQICLEFARLFPSETAYMAALNDCVHQMKDEAKFYKNQGIMDPNIGFQHFQKEFSEAWNGKPVDQTNYPEKMFSKAYEYYRDITASRPNLTDEIKNIWSDFKGYDAQSVYFPEVDNQYAEYEKPFEPSHLDDVFMFHRREVLMYLTYKKYAKSLSTYLEGLFGETQKLVLIDPRTNVAYRDALPEEYGVNPNVVYRAFIKFNCMGVSSKRWYINAVYGSNIIENERAKTVKTEMSIPC